MTRIFVENISDQPRRQMYVGKRATVEVSTLSHRDVATVEVKPDFQDGHVILADAGLESFSAAVGVSLERIQAAIHQAIESHQPLFAATV